MTACMDKRADIQCMLRMHMYAHDACVYDTYVHIHSACGVCRVALRRGVEIRKIIKRYGSVTGGGAEMKRSKKAP